MIAYTRDQRAGQSRDHTREQSGLRTALAIISGDKPCSHYPEPQQEAGTLPIGSRLLAGTATAGPDLDRRPKSAAPGDREGERLRWR